MSLLSGTKRLINNSFKVFGYEIVKYVREKEKVWQVNDPIAHNSLEKIDEFYSSDNFLDTYIGEARTEFYNTIVDFIQSQRIPLNNKSVVDVGCGTGHLLAFLKDKLGFEKGTGLEYSPEGIKIGAKLFPFLEFYQYDVNTTWIKNYDFVLCTEVLEHLLHPEVALRNMTHMIKEKGQALITVPNGRTDTFGGHINFWSPESWKIFINSNTNGYEVETGLLHEKDVNYALIRKCA